MFESKYSNFLTVLLIIIIIAVIGLIVFFSYRVYREYKTGQEADDFVNTFTPTENNPTEDSNNQNNISDGELTEDQQNSLNNVDKVGDLNQNTQTNTQQYKGYNVIGTIRIPKINLNYPILEKASKSSIEVSVAMLWGVGPNKPGNTLIIGHNYRNGLFFANNKNLSIGDKIYIKDLSGTELSYTIYDKFEAEENETDFLTIDTKGARIVTLQTCTDAGNNYRLIILAKCDED